VLSLPIYPKVGADNQARIVQVIAESLAAHLGRKRVA
jgi:hypothetical protein